MAPEFRGANAAAAPRPLVLAAGSQGGRTYVTARRRLLLAVAAALACALAACSSGGTHGYPTTPVGTVYFLSSGNGNIEIHGGSSTSSPVLGTLQDSDGVGLICTVQGEAVSSEKGGGIITTTLWDYVLWADYPTKKYGFVSDAWVDDAQTK